MGKYKVFKYQSSSLINNIFNKNKDLIELKITKDMNEVDAIDRNIIKDYYTYMFDYNVDGVLYGYLAEEYEPLLCSYNIYTLPFLQNYGGDKNSSTLGNRLKIVNGNTQIDDILLVPVSKGYTYHYNSSLLFDYYNMVEDLPLNSTVCIVYIIGPYDIKDKKLYLNFELEDLLTKVRNCKVKTLFILIDHGENIEYNTIMNTDNRDYIIIDMNKKDEKIISQFIKDINDFIMFECEINDYTYCQRALASLPIYLYLFNIILKKLPKGGNIYMEKLQMNVTKPIIQFLYYISTLFDTTKVFILELNIWYHGIYKFENYTYNDEILDSIVKEYIKLDPYLGMNTIVKINKDGPYSYCMELEHNNRKPNIDFIIKSIMKKHINDDFMNFITDSYKYKNDIYMKQLNKMAYLREQGDRLDIEMILSNNISKSIEFCNNHNIIVNDIYKTYKIIKYENVVKIYFPLKNNVDLKKIELSLDSIYSITKPTVAKKMCELIKKYFKSVTHMIDGCANVGTTTIAFSEYFNNVTSIEYNKDTFEKLKYNISLYKLKNVEVINTDTIEYMKKYKGDKNKYCLFLDPPWSGVYYKTENELDLFLGNMNILDIIKMIDTKYICIKAPSNYNFKGLYKYFYNIIIYRLAGFYFILIEK